MKQRSKRLRAAILGGSLSVLALVWATGVAAAAVLTVDTVLDVVDGGDGVLSLREALADSTAGDEIQFDASLNGQSIVLGGSQLVVSKNLSITGPGADLVRIDANSSSRVFLVNSAITVTISGLTITGGDTSSGGSGGGISSSGTLQLHDCVVTGNVGPANLVGGGLISSGSLLLLRTTVSDSTGEGIRVQNGPATLLDSTVSGSSAPGLVAASGSSPILIKNSTFEGNDSSFAGGAINNSSSGVAITLVNSTISGNSSPSIAGGIWAGNGSLTLINSTVTNNTASNHGGGISRASATVTIRNSIVAGNSAPGDADCSINSGSGVWVTDDYNLFGDGSGCPAGATDQTTSDPASVLKPLANKGGPTRTHALVDGPGNPAIDGGDPAGCTDEVGAALKFDQRGGSRLVGSSCDVGSFEFGGISVPGVGAIGRFALSALLLCFGAIQLLSTRSKSGRGS